MLPRSHRINTETSFSVGRFYPLHVIFHWDKRERERKGGGRGDDPNRWSHLFRPPPLANEISRWRDSKGIGLTTRRAQRRNCFFSRRYVRATCTFYLCPVLYRALPCRLFTGVHRLAVIIVGIYPPCPHSHPPLQHPASDARYNFAASSRRRPSLNLILTDQRRRGESSDGRYAGKWPENSIPPPSILPFFRKILPPLLRSHNASKYVS